MPHAIFFYYGFAIHGTNQVRHLGSPASHGCVRLAPQNATKLFNQRAEGGTITISGSPPGQPPVNAALNSGGVQRAGGLLSILGL